MPSRTTAGDQHSATAPGCLSRWILAQLMEEVSTVSCCGALPEPTGQWRSHACHPHAMKPGDTIGTRSPYSLPSSTARDGCYGHPGRQLHLCSCPERDGPNHQQAEASKLLCTRQEQRCLGHSSLGPTAASTPNCPATVPGLCLIPRATAGRWSTWPDEGSRRQELPQADALSLQRQCALKLGLGGKARTAPGQ